MILMMTLNWSSDFNGIFIEIPPGIPFPFVRTSSTNKEKSLKKGLAALLTLSIYA
jgi:hypothetical protein